MAAAILVAASVVWFLHRAYCPVILEAIQKMPETAHFADSHLMGVPDTLIAESRFLAIVVTTHPDADIGQEADLQIQFRSNDFCAGSVYWPDWGLDFRYQPGRTLNLARSNLEPGWSAWQPVVLTLTGVALVLCLLLLWSALAVVYMAPAKLIAWFADRYLPWRGAWRLASAALLPGALVMTGTVYLYAWSIIDLAGLSFFTAVHLIIGWVYLIGASCKVTRLFPTAANRNPFT
jgi:hypothetical protein